MHEKISGMSYRLPPLNALRAFEAAARHLSFKKAADELAVTPTAVSHQLRGLEDSLGFPLFRRLTRSSAFRHELPRDKPQSLSCSSLPSDALVEFVVWCRQGLRIRFPLGLSGQ